MSRVLHILYMFVALLCVLSLTGWYIYQRDLPGQYLKLRESDRMVRDAMREKQALEREHDKLSQAVRASANDPLEIEASIRAKNNLVREGEVVYQVELPEEVTQAP